MKYDLAARPPERYPREPPLLDSHQHSPRKAAKEKQAKALSISKRNLHPAPEGVAVLIDVCEQIAPNLMIANVVAGLSKHISSALYVISCFADYACFGELSAVRAMGGDGGTLNNSRLDHVRLRRELSSSGGPHAAASQRASRASVTLCAASRQPLRAPVVADRLGQLFNKDVLIACMLARSPAFAHVRSLRRDVSAEVALAPDGATLRCALSQDAVTPDGRFGLGWGCGCVVSNDAAQTVSGRSEAGSYGENIECVACGNVGRRIGIALTREERDAVLADIVAAREKSSLRDKTRASRKRAALPKIDERDVPTKAHSEFERQRNVRLRPDEQSAASGFNSEVQSTVFKSLFMSSYRETNEQK